MINNHRCVSKWHENFKSDKFEKSTIFHEVLQKSVSIFTIWKTRFCCRNKSAGTLENFSATLFNKLIFLRNSICRKLHRFIYGFWCRNHMLYKKTKLHYKICTKHLCGFCSDYFIIFFNFKNNINFFLIKIFFQKSLIDLNIF